LQSLKLLSMLAVATLPREGEPPTPPTPPAPGAPPNPNPGGTPPADPPNPNPEPEDKKDPAYWEKKAKDTAKEAQGLRERLRTLEDNEKKRTDAEKTELQRAQDKIAELEKSASQSQQQARDARIAIRAQKLGFADPEDASKFIRTADLKEDDSNLDELLKEVLKSKPYLKGSTERGVPPVGGGNPPSHGAESAVDKAKTEKLTNALPFLKKRVNSR
jgi:hypothetical protein